MLKERIKQYIETFEALYGNYVNSEGRIDLAEKYEQLGNLECEDGNLDAANEAFGKALTIYEEENCERKNIKLTLKASGIYEKLGELFFEGENLESAKQCYAQAGNGYYEAANAEKTVEIYGKFGSCSCKEGEISYILDEYVAAYDEFSTAIAVYEEIVKETEDEEYIRKLSKAQYELGKLSSEEGDIHESQLLFIDALLNFAPIEDERLRKSDYKLMISAYMEICRLDRALEVCETACRRFPEDEEFIKKREKIRKKLEE